MLETLNPHSWATVAIFNQTGTKSETQVNLGQLLSSWYVIYQKVACSAAVTETITDKVKGSYSLTRTCILLQSPFCLICDQANVVWPQISFISSPKALVAASGTNRQYDKNIFQVLLVFSSATFKIFSSATISNTYFVYILHYSFYLQQLLSCYCPLQQRCQFSLFHVT